MLLRVNIYIITKNKHRFVIDEFCTERSFTNKTRCPFANGHLVIFICIECGLFHTLYNFVCVACNHKLLVGGYKQYLDF